MIENVPANGRNIFTLQYTEPGVIKQSTYCGSMELWAYSDVNGVSINGGRSGENEVLDSSHFQSGRRCTLFLRCVAEHVSRTAWIRSKNEVFKRDPTTT